MKFSLVVCALLLTACDSSAAAYLLTPSLESPVVRAAVAQAQTTATAQAQDARLAQILVDAATQSAALTETAVPPQLTVAAGTAQAVALAAAVDGRHATETATAEVGANAVTASARQTALYLSGIATADAFAKSQVEHFAEMQSVETRVAAEQKSVTARAQAQAAGWWILFVGGALAVVIVALFAAVRVAGPGLHHAGKMAAETIRANGDAYAAGRRADGDYTLSEAQAGAALLRAQTPPAATPKQKLIEPVVREPHVLAALEAIKKAMDLAGDKARFFPTSTELGGATRAALGPLKSIGAIRTILGKGGGSYVVGYPSLAALYAAVATGDLPLPRPVSAETERLTAPKLPKQAV